MPAILIVEDERNLCHLIRDNLQEQGYRVLQAFDGPSALALAKDAAPDLVILDIMLPGVAGLAAGVGGRKGTGRGSAARAA